MFTNQCVLKSDECTWEPRSNLDSCKEKLKEYFANRRVSEKSHTNSSETKNPGKSAEEWLVCEKSDSFCQLSRSTNKSLKRKFPNYSKYYLNILV